MSEITLPITGSCLCKKINYSIAERPKGVGLCHCRSCQIKSGSDHIAYMIVSRDAVNIHGTVKWFSTIGDSGQEKQHGFCPECGSHLFGRPSYWPHILAVYLGALHNADDFKPEKNIWMSEARVWTCVNESLLRFDGNPS